MHVNNQMFIHGVYNMDRAVTFYGGCFDVPVDFRSPDWTTLDFGSIVPALHTIGSGQKKSPVPMLSN